MNISGLKQGESAVVQRITLEGAAAERLRRLNIEEGARVTLLRALFKGRTFLLQAGSARLAVSREIAEGIECRK